jgi:hypothetical protein
METLDVGDYVEFANDRAQRTPKGSDVRLPIPSGVKLGDYGVVTDVTKTGGAGMALVTGPISAMPGSSTWPSNLWYVTVDFNGRKGTLLGGQLRKLSLLEVLAWSSQ